MTQPHDWHMFDEKLGLECRQVTDKDQPNQWEIRKQGEEKTVLLTDTEFELLREDGPNPKGL